MFLQGLLAEFASVVEAVTCAVSIQTKLRAENAELPLERRMQFRIGVNLGDVMVEGEQIYGDGVNVTARLESLADPGGICISGTVHEQVRDKLTLACEDRGEQAVNDIVLGFQYKSDAERFREELAQRLRKFRLELHPDKTRLVEFGSFAAANRQRRGQEARDVRVPRLYAHLRQDAERTVYGA